jgi:hypothetical protein
MKLQEIKKLNIKTLTLYTTAPHMVSPCPLQAYRVYSESVNFIHKTTHVMITVDTKKAEMVFGALLETYLQKKYPYNQKTATLPQEYHFLPQAIQKNLGSREHALYLFKLCY